MKGEGKNNTVTAMQSKTMIISSSFASFFAKLCEYGT
jgi:hypothetical protein